jgi:sugar/nucleoside kinase (ribokinase family)
VLEQLPKARGVLVTAGENGCSYCMRSNGRMENTGYVSVYKVDVQDTTGAGDAFTCGFLAYLLAEVCRHHHHNSMLISNQSFIGPCSNASSCTGQGTKSTASTRTRQRAGTVITFLMLACMHIMSSVFTQAVYWGSTSASCSVA